MTRTFSRFADRTEGGERLAALLDRRGIDPDRVLAVARGGVPVGGVVADALGADLDVAVTRTLDAPETPQLAVGAVAAAGADVARWLDDDVIDHLGTSDEYLEDATAHETDRARERRDRYHEGSDSPARGGEPVLIVDDGITAPAIAAACVRAVRAEGAERVIVGAPVAPPDTVESLREVADGALAAMTPAGGGAVGRFYESFEPVSEEEALGVVP